MSRILDEANRQIREKEREDRQKQRTAAQNALDSANLLVNALTANSTAAQVQAAQAAVSAAADAVTDAASLSDGERASLSARLNAIRANLAAVIARRNAQMERMAAQRKARTDAGTVSYSHVTFGVWTGPSRAGGDSQTPASLGHGFVEKTDTGMRTGGGMPNFGSATYRGVYVAHVRAAAATGNGAIAQRRGTALITANFASGGFRATLQHLATLTGKIEDDSFSGAAATPHAQPGTTTPALLPATGAYTGSFQGHFYGPRAVEAAGVFDFTSVGRKDGEFRGAFGGSQ